MGKVSVLDCTLRDGGYVNEFRFGKKVIKNVINKLSSAAIDIIECGFMKYDEYDENKTIYSSVADIQNIIGEKNKNCLYVAMIQYGAISADMIESYNGLSIDGIRLTFHEHEIEPAFELAGELMKKGYKVFIQPVGTTNYDDGSLIELINKVNKLKPYAFYMVDTLGVMYKSDLIRMFCLIDHNLDNRIALGFHSHNNLQMSFANAQELSQFNTQRNIIIDSSILGMGRGAGNLNTELLVQYLNYNFSLKYDIFDIMTLMDEYIVPLKSKYKWGYDSSYFIAATAGCHPNYAAFLLNMQTLCIRDISAILKSLDVNKRILYDEKYINEEYIKYMEHNVDDKLILEYLRNTIKDKKVLLLAPGKSLKIHEKEISEFIKKGNYFIISINFYIENLLADVVFVSNLKRFKNFDILNNKHMTPIIVTSNICQESKNNVSVINYSSYLNEENCIVDNAGLMCINILKSIGVKSVFLAGFDGFSENIEENYYEESLCLDVEKTRLVNMNIAISNKIKQLKKQMDIQFLFASSYENLF